MSTTTLRHTDFISLGGDVTREQTSRLMDVVRESLSDDIVGLFDGVYPLNGANVVWFMSTDVYTKTRKCSGDVGDIKKYLTKLSKTNKEVSLEFSYFGDELRIRIATDNGDM